VRFLIHWALRREELCDPGLCPDAPDEGGRCDHCPLDKVDEAQNSERGQLLRLVFDLRSALRLHVPVPLCEIGADELQAMLIVEDEQERRERELARRLH
jgi:hypothetical protein